MEGLNNYMEGPISYFHFFQKDRKLLEDNDGIKEMGRTNLQEFPSLNTLTAVPDVFHPRWQP